MVYSDYKNSIMIIDQSAWQQIEFTLSQPNQIDVRGFFETNKVLVCAPVQAINELGYQIYKPNLLSGSDNTNFLITSGAINLDSGYVLSQINGSLTPVNLDQNGLGILLIESNAVYSSTFGGQTLLWDTTPIMQKFALCKRSPVDFANIILARSLQYMSQNVFVFVNDQKQIDQLKFEGIKYLRPDDLFAWMCRSKFIDPRKGAWNFKKRRINNARWTKPSTNFKDYLH